MEHTFYLFHIPKHRLWSSFLPEGEEYVPFAQLTHAACFYRNYSNLSFTSFTRITQSNKRNFGFHSYMMHMQLLNIWGVAQFIKMILFQDYFFYILLTWKVHYVSSPDGQIQFEDSRRVLLSAKKFPYHNCCNLSF